jgi:hypothetical protein
MFFPWNATIMLAIESSRVIGLRLTKMTFGGMEACDEALLMVSEKVEAATETWTTIMADGSASVIVDRYREHVALNEKRLCLN